MNRMLTCPMLLLAASAASAAPAHDAPTPKEGMLKVAVVLSEGATVIDFAGPWEVFQDTMLDDGHGGMVAPFDLYTVAPSKKPLHATGSGRPGLTIVPDFDFSDAPAPDIVVVGAQSGGPGLSEWLQKMHAERKTVMSVCTGAFKLAKAGLLDGKQATTHHWFFGNFERDYPGVKLVRDARYVQSDPLTFTAGGLSSGIDLALHVVAERFGAAEAQKTADYMEYQGTGWKSAHVAVSFPTPITRQDWSGRLADSELVLHEVTYGASPAFSIDVPAQHVAGAPATIVTDHGKVSIAFDIAGRRATFEGHADEDGRSVSGTFTQDGKSQPLTLTRHAAAD